jgi:hypothetical protein
LIRLCGDGAVSNEAKLGSFFTTKSQNNARNIKGENTGLNTKMEYTPLITALSEIALLIIAQLHKQPI